MKKTDWGILGLTFAYSFLFYEQNLGFNCLLFTLIFLSCLLWLEPNRIKQTMWLILAACCLFSAVFVFIYSSTISVIALYCSFLLVSAASSNPNSSVILNFLYGLYSIFGSLVFMTINTYLSLTQKKETNERNLGFRFLSYLIPIVIAFIFFFIYKNANPLFEKYTKWINLDFISLQWLGFTFWGLLLSYGLIRHQRIKDIDNWENNLPLSISQNTTSTGRWNERKSVFILFVLLNIMLLFINALDVNYLYLGAGMPNGLTHKQFVHHGVGTLIFSIVLGISIILFFFRGALNFNAENRSVRMLVYVWLAQNLMMVISTACRNHIYVMDALLTYKRIGVYYWLFLAALGLVTTYFKIKNGKSAWYMIKNNALFAFVILVISAGFDWDKYISAFNMKHVPNIAGLDKRYLISLSSTNLAQLYEIKSHKDFNTDSSYHYPTNRRIKNTTALDTKLVSTLTDLSKGDWRSYSVRKSRVLNEIEALNDSQKISSLNLTNAHFDNFKPLFTITQLRKLELGANHLPNQQWLDEIKHFKNLDAIGMSYLQSSHIQYLSALKNLKSITLTYTDKNVIESLKTKMPGVQIIDKGNSVD